MPFATLDEKSFPVPVLAQVDRNDFEICVPFKYRRYVGDPWVTVPKGEQYRRTDLASVPGFLLWLVPRYGVHTLAALLHDQLVKDPPAGGRIEADTIFRDALGELQVPWIRRWMMWAAVSGGTIAESLAGKIRLVCWGLLVALAAAMLWLDVVAAITSFEAPAPWFLFGHGLARDLAVVAGSSLIFLPRLGLGLLAGACLLLFLVPTLAVLVWIGVYLLLERLARFGLSAYNAALAPRLGADRVENVRAVISLSDDLPSFDSTLRGCPELAASAEPSDGSSP